MIIFLDFDGVMITTPAWKQAELDKDGFLKFNPRSANNLEKIITEMNASIILTTTHRINYSIKEWREIFINRGIHAVSITKINDVQQLSKMGNRASEINDWFNVHGDPVNYVIIDDDLSINGLPEHIKKRCVLTKSMIGLDDEATEKVLGILKQ